MQQLLLRDFACPLYKLQLLCHTASRIVSRTAQSFGAKARKRACCEPSTGWCRANQGDADSRGIDLRAQRGFDCWAPFNAVGSGRASEGLSRAVDMGRGARSCSNEDAGFIFGAGGVTRVEVTRDHHT